MAAGPGALAASCFFAAALLLPRPLHAQVVVAGTLGTPETDLTPEQEQRLLAEYWTAARRYRLEPARAIADLGAWTRDRIGKVQSIQFQPETAPRPEYLEGKAEWNPATLRQAAMLHTDIGLAAYRKGNLQEFEFQIGIADGWLILADNRQSAPGSLRSRWTVTVARLLLASGDIGVADRILMRANERIGGDPALQLAYATVKETEATRLMADIAGGRVDEPPAASKRRDAALSLASSLLEKALALQPGLVEAKLRLAHVRIMRREDARAEPLLGEILAAEPAPAIKYLASLMLGGVRSRQNQIDAAARTYLDGILAVPDGQSGYVALAHVMAKAGQPGDASTVLERLFARAIVNPVADPWWTYPLGLDLTMDAQFEEYRALVRK